jgi:nucleoside-diphosphate-sugar epimerase
MATPILVTGAAGRVGGVGRTVAELLLKQGKSVRAMMRIEDQRAQALRDLGAEVVIGDLLDLESMHKVIAGCETMYFGMSVSDTYLAAKHSPRQQKRPDKDTMIDLRGSC